MTLVPAPPKKYVQVEDLEVGKKYWIESGMGGVFTVEYEGKIGAWYQFKNLGEGWPEFCIAHERVESSIHVCYGVMTEEEWRAAGGKFYDN